MNDQPEFIPRGSNSGHEISRPDEILPDTLQLIPLSSRPYFPVLVQPIVVDKEPWGASIKAVSETAHRLVGLSLAPGRTAPGREGPGRKGFGRKGSGREAPGKPEEQAIPSPDSICEIGCVARIHQINEIQGKYQFIAQGIRRFKIVEWITKQPPYVVKVKYFEKAEPEDDSQLKAYAMAIINIIKELMKLNPLYNEELKNYLNYFNPNDPSPLTDFAAAITSADGMELQDVLETIPLQERMEKVLLIIGKELEVAKIQAQITEQMQEQVTEQQREFFLRQQLKVIQKELGISKDDRQADVEKFTDRLGKLKVPEHVQKKADEELDKLQILEITSPEYGVTRNYLDWLTSVPWGLTSKDMLDLDRALEILNKDHDGLEDVKQRIIEFLAVGAYKGEIAGSILLLVGPPGVGKTSIGRSVAKALGRKFFRFSLGGMRDEAEIKGHRRTYIGAMPGKLVQALKEVEVVNPVIMLDEIDKIGASYQGDPASALLEVLDPEQNSEFLDHYLDLRLDLSKVLFICTANQLDTIPPPLLDRMETIRLAGYLTEEKMLIARHHLWKRQMQKAGLPASKLKINKTALREIIEGYARDAGVRALEKQLGKIVRVSVIDLLKAKKNSSITISVADVHRILGSPIFKKQKPYKGVGVVNGLAWTALGGTTLAIEASQVHGGSRGFKQTGQLGDVMRESAEIAYSYVASHIAELGGDADFFNNAFIHLHVPEGATPKDGPSAGITIATALLSLALNKEAKREIAMTGELTLTGRVLPIGGIKEKLIAARRAGFDELIFPSDNERDYDELPDYLKVGISAHFVENYTDVFKVYFK